MAHLRVRVVYIARKKHSITLRRSRIHIRRGETVAERDAMRCVLLQAQCGVDLLTEECSLRAARCATPDSRRFVGHAVKFSLIVLFQNKSINAKSLHYFFVI